MKRLCFLLPNIDCAHELVSELKLSGVAEDSIHLLANENTPLEELPDAGYDRTDFYPALERGLAAGAAIGLVAGLIAMRLAGGILGGGAVLLIMMESSLISGWLAAIGGSAFPSSRLKKYEAAIEEGEVLMMIDVNKNEVDQTIELVKKHHPEVVLDGFEPPAPIIP